MVVQPARLVDLARVMRRMVIEIHRAALASEGQTANSEQLYQYLESSDFREAFAAIERCSDELERLLSTEQKTHERTWGKRHDMYTDLARKLSSIDGRITAIIQRQEGPQHRKVVRIRARA